MNSNFTLASRLSSIRYAAQGIKSFLSTEHNARIHLACTAMITAASFILHISGLEWIAIMFCIGAVWTAEIFNTCVERIMDYLTQDKVAQVKQIKDMAAAAVLVTSTSALIIAGIIFLPKIYALI